MQEQAPLDLRRDYFATLREEIRATKARIFIIMMFGILGAPVLAYVSAWSDSQLLIMLAPFVVLLLIVLYLSEQTLLMRAGRFIRDKVESSDSDWEHWVGGLNLRSAERQLFAMFVVIGLFFYIILLMRAIEFMVALQPEVVRDYQYFFWKYGIAVLYAAATVWALITVARFWHSAVSTSED